MSRLQGFPPAGAEVPGILILGSFPSIASLELGEYYGHARNHFWTLIGHILGFDPGLPFAERLTRLAEAGIALWDVFGACERDGSLDQAIRGESPNALAEYIGARPSIERIALNGGKATASFVARFAPELRPARGAAGFAIGSTVPWSPSFAPDRRITLARLPSSSPVPTKAFRRASDKLPLWSAFIGLPPGRP